MNAAQRRNARPSTKTTFGKIRAAYLAQFADDSALDIYVETWEAAVTAHGRGEAVKIFWSVMDSLPHEQRSSCDPDGN